MERVLCQLTPDVVCVKVFVENKMSVSAQQRTAINK